MNMYHARVLQFPCHPPMHGNARKEGIMARFISRRAPVSVSSLKRRPIGTVVRRHNNWEDVKFTRVTGGWLRVREDFTGLSPVIVTSATVARECNGAIGCTHSWAKVY